MWLSTSVRGPPLIEGDPVGILRKFLGDEHPTTQTVRGNLEAVKMLLGGKHQTPGLRVP